MDEKTTQMIKDLSESFFYIVSAIAVIAKTTKKKSNKSKSKKRKR